MSKELLWPTTFVLAVGVGYVLGAETKPSPTSTSDLPTQLAPLQVSSAPLPPQEVHKSSPIGKPERPAAVTPARPELEPTAASPPVALRHGALPPAHSPQQAATALVEAFLAFLPTEASAVAGVKLDPPSLLEKLLDSLDWRLPKEVFQPLAAAAFRSLPSAKLLPDDPEVAFVAARDAYRAAPDKIRLGLLATTLRDLSKSRQLMPAERTLLESLALDHSGNEDLELAIIRTDPEWARRHLARDGWTPTDARRLAQGKGPLAEQAAFEVLAAGLDTEALKEAHRLAPERTLELLSSMAHDPAWARAATMLRFRGTKSAQDRLRIFEQTWETWTDREVAVAVYYLGYAARGRMERAVWSPTLSRAAQRVIRADDSRNRTLILRSAPLAHRIELLGALATRLNESSEIDSFMEFLSEFPFVARAQLPDFLALFPGLSSRGAIEFAAKFQRMGDPQGARRILDAIAPSDHEEAEAARALLQGGGWLFDLVE